MAMHPNDRPAEIAALAAVLLGRGPLPFRHLVPGLRRTDPHTSAGDRALAQGNLVLAILAVALLILAVAVTILSPAIS